MSEPNVFYYETEIEWTKEKEGRLNRAKLCRRLRVERRRSSMDVKGPGLRNISLWLR